jgi:putative DNA primase/helicase
MFADFCRAHGLRVQHVEADGRWHRCPTEDKPGRRNGAWKYLGDVGFVQNHATMTEIAVWRPETPVTYADQQRTEARIRALRAQEARRRTDAIKGMRDYFRALPKLSGGHPYLEGKGLSMRGCAGLRIDGDTLVIPMWLNGFLMSLQTITPAGEKKYRAGCPVAGAAFVIEPAVVTVTTLAEGFATGLAVHQCVPQARVIVCFDAGNLVRVAQAAKVRGLAVVCADNDHTGSVNTGIEKGRQAAEAIGCGLAYPEGIKGTDFADMLAELENPARVRMAILKGAKFVGGPP